METTTTVWQVEATPIAVRVHWKTVVTHQGNEIADKDGMTMLFKNSDWSEMEEWVQKICRAVFDE